MKFRPTSNWLFSLLFGAFFPSLGTAQQESSVNIGVPAIINHTNSDYKAGTQNWNIVQDQRGIMYFANNNGLLEYDGLNWECYPLANKTICRSLAIDEAGRIYVGGQGEFGYFQADQTGRLCFHSLENLIPKEHRNFDDVWQTLILKDEVLFRTSQKLYSFSRDQISVYDQEPISFIAKADSRVFVRIEGQGLKIRQNQGFTPLPGGELLSEKEVTGIWSLSSDTVMVSTLKSGLYVYDGIQVREQKTNSDAFYRENRIYCAYPLSNGKSALGTSKEGLLIINRNGAPVSKLSKASGLQNNNILSLFQDRSGNLWLGLDNGIDYIEIASPFSRLYPDEDLAGTAYAAMVHNNSIYFGTNNGLYRSDWLEYYNPFNLSRYEQVAEGQVWNLFSSDGTLLMGHHEGLFEVRKEENLHLSKGPGAWVITPLEHHPGYAMAGNYKGLALYEINQYQEWKFVKQLPGLEESCRFVTEDNEGNLWVSHPYRGVYRVKLARDLSHITQVDLFNSAQGFPSDLFIHVFKIHNELIFSAEYGLFKFNPDKDRFEPHDELNQHFGEDAQTKRLFEDPNGNIWFVVDEEAGILKIQDQGLKKEVEKIVFPQLESQLVGGFEFIYPLDERNVFVGTEIGFIHFNPLAVDPERAKIDIVLRQVKLIGQRDSTLFAGTFGDSSGLVNEQPEWAIPEFSSDQNNLVFNFSATVYANRDKVSYQYRLEGLNKDWSNWTAKTEKEYTNLSPGTYVFEVKARNIHGKESGISRYKFIIHPPWYLTSVAFTIYGIFLLLVLLGLIFIPRNRYERQKAQLKSEQARTLMEKEQEHSREMEQTENELMQLRNEKLRVEIQHQKKELASSTMHLVQKGEMLNKIRDELIKAESSSTSPTVQKALRQVIKMIHADSQLDQDWEQFENYFDQVHVDFLQRLKESYPNLTPKDIRLCAYLRMNLSTKEIAPLMNISVRGVEISRYRLRKKLELPGDNNLVEFMRSI